MSLVDVLSEVNPHQMRGIRGSKSSQWPLSLALCKPPSQVMARQTLQTPEVPNPKSSSPSKLQWSYPQAGPYPANC